MPGRKLITLNIGGNLHAAARWINDCELLNVGQIVALDSSGHNTILVLNVAADFDQDTYFSKRWDERT